MAIDPNEAVAAIRAIETYGLIIERSSMFKNFLYLRAASSLLVSEPSDWRLGPVSAVRDWCRKNNKPWPGDVAATEE